ncbi:permease [Desulfosporosinus sp. FKB]|uniref:permease n=1 Tax=Desulfosporosinus sp. FKB TaxID=1969835 RepID=UPI001FA82187|nr:permease [Desulfosporosinus sp. FKB]
MEYAKSMSSKKVYLMIYGSTLFIALGFRSLQNAIISEQVKNVVTLALSIILQALPFILIGVLASSIIRVLIREEWIARFSPSNSIAGVILGALLGLIFPVCDCGVMPVARSLLRKGVSMQTAFAYLLTAPVINPTVILATALAFQWNWHLVVLRLLGTFVVGGTIALLIGYFFNPKDLGVSINQLHHNDHHSGRQSIHEILLHAVDEFFDIGRFLIVSAFLASAIQVWVSKSILFQFVNNPSLSVAALMVLGILMSLCSEADAFVARVLANQFPLGSVLSFLVIGQILDLRNMILFSKNFRQSLFLFIAIMSIILTFLWGWGIDVGLRLHL